MYGIMRPNSKKEALWRTLGQEVRHHWQLGHGTGKAMRNLTRRQCHKAVRAAGKAVIQEAVKEIRDGV